eukprot:7864544-Prorocentrum_lima.AAC.1
MEQGSNGTAWLQGATKYLENLLLGTCHIAGGRRDIQQGVCCTHTLHLTETVEFKLAMAMTAAMGYVNCNVEGR